MKKISYILLLFLVFLSACSSSNPQENQEEVKVYKVGVVSNRAEEIWAHVNERLEPEEGIRVETVLFSDYVNPNKGLLDGSIDANAYQFIPFLDEFNQQHDSDLLPIGYLSVEPLGIWASDGIESMDDIPQGAKVAVINDPVNIGKALDQMQAAGLIELDDQAGPIYEEKDIISNPKAVEIVPMDAGMVTRSLNDVELVMPGATAASEAGLSKEDAIYFEDTSQTPYLFRLTFVTRPELADDPDLLTVLDYYQEQDTVDYANETGEGVFYPGWENEDDARQDYLEYTNRENQ